MVGFKNFYNKIDDNSKISFIVTFLFGIIIHMYKFTNDIPGHDSFFYTHNHFQDMTSSGRWFLGIICWFSSNLRLPWVLGVLGIIYISISTVLIIKLFNINNKLMIIIFGGMMVTFPSIANTSYFEFTFDGYMFSMLLATSSVYITRIMSKDNNYKCLKYFIGTILLCLSLAIYQSYISFAFLLTIFYFLYKLFEGKCDNKEYWSYIIKQIIMYIISMVLYFVLWKMICYLGKYDVTTYQGINKLTFGLSSVFMGSKKSLIMFFRVMFNSGKFSLTLVLNVVFLLCLIIVYIITVVKTKIYRRKMLFVFSILCIVSIPFVSCLWYYTSETVVYDLRMLGCYVLLYLFLGIIVEKYCSVTIRELVAVLFAIIIINNSVQVNMQYYYMNLAYKKTCSEISTYVDFVKRTDYEGEKFKKVAFCVGKGHAYSDKYEADFEEMDYYYIVESDLIEASSLVADIIKYNFVFNYDILERYETNKLENNNEVIEMPCWPKKGSTKIIDDILVIKINNL